MYDQRMSRRGTRPYGFNKKALGERLRAALDADKQKRMSIADNWPEAIKDLIDRDVDLDKVEFKELSNQLVLSTRMAGARVKFAWNRGGNEWRGWME